MRKNKFLLLFLSGFFILTFIKTSNANLTKYCAVPPTIGYSVSPNIMIVLQDDARMRWRAYCYDNDGDGWCDNGYNPTYNYDGYFEPDKLYRWNPTEHYWEKINSGKPASCPDTNNKYPIEYKETFPAGSSSYTLNYSVIRGSLKIYNLNLPSYSGAVYDDGNGNLRRVDNNALVGSITYSNSSGKGVINFYETVNSSFDVYYGYNLNEKNIYYGKCLNYHFMTRIDIVRFLLTGGSPRSCPTSYIGPISNATPQFCDPRQNTVDKVSSTEVILKTQDFEDWDLRWVKGVCWDSSYCIRNYTFSGIPVKADISRVYTGILYKQASLDEIGKVKPRIGLITYDTAWPVIHNNKVYIGDFRKSISDYNKNYEYQHIITSLNANRDLLEEIPTSSCKTAGIWDAGNSMAPALWDVYRYFAQQTPLYCGLDPSTNSSDKWKNPLYQCIKFDSSGNCIGVAKAPCSKNFVILITEGMWNIGSDSSGNLIKTCKIDDGFENFSSDPVVPIYWMHKNGMINEGDNINIDKVYVLNIWAYSKYGKMASKLMSVFGSFDTKNNWPEGYTGYPQSTCDLSAYNSAFTSCKGSLCENSLHTGTGYSWDKNNDGIPDTYFEVNTVEDLRRALETAFSDIQKNVASSSTTALLTGRNDKGAILEQVLFYPTKVFEKPYEVNWISQLFTFWYYKATNVQNIREDTNKNFKLDVLIDKVIEYYLDNNQQLKIDVCNVNSDGSASSTCITKNDVNKVNYLIETGKELSKVNYSDRVIYSVDENNQLRRFTASNKNYFDTLLGTDINEFPTCLQTSGNIDYEKTINYLLGQQITGCRNKVINSDGDTWKLADVMHSSPQIVSYPNYDVVFISSNDGVLHAFKIGKYKRINSNSTVAELLENNKGEELWGFIPQNALPYIRYLADPNYCHIYITDLRAYILEIDNDGDKIIDRKILIGGFRLGGGCGCTDGNCITPPSDTCPDPTSSSCVGLSSYYALDITNPENPVYLWEFKHKDLRFTYSGPGIIRTKDNKYHVVFASGPINYTGQFLNTNNQELKIFVLDLETGSLERIISTGIQKAFAGRIFSKGFDFDEDGYTDYLAFGYTRQDGSDTNYKGGIILLGGSITNGNLYPFNTNVYNWNFVNFTTFGTDINPVVSKVEFMKCFGRWYMYFGTGRWFKNIDDWEVNNNTLFGIPIDIKEDSDGNKYISLITNTENMTDLNNQNICTKAQHNVIKGWYINLEGSSTDHLKEKMITDPIKTPYNVVLFATIEPVKAICGLGGRTRVWGLNCATGGVITGCNVNDLYQINPSTVQGMLLLQLSGGNIEQININNIAQNTGSRTTDWSTGIAPEGAPPFVKPYKELKGKILLWLER